MQRILGIIFCVTLTPRSRSEIKAGICYGVPSTAVLMLWVDFFQKNYFRNTIRVSNGLDPDQDLDPNCLQSYQQTTKVVGAQWLSGRVLDSRPRGRGFELHRPHCVVVLEQDTFILA